MSSSPKASQSRRAFLERSSGLILGACAASCRGNASPSEPKAKDGTTQDSDPQPSTSAVPGSSGNTKETSPSTSKEEEAKIEDVPMDFGPLPTQCPLVLPMTKGPCTAQEDSQIRQDLREGWAGLQLYVGLRIVDKDCKPVQDAQVSLWHTNYEGSYSSQTPANDFCVFDPSYLEQSFFRGQQISDRQGQVRFLSCYPGWYPGRAVHIHLQVTKGNQQSRATQLYFPAAYTDALFASHPKYRDRGAADTSNTTDEILGRASPAQQQALTFDLVNDPNFGLIALKTISIVA